MDTTVLTYYVKGNFEVQREIVGDRSVQEAVTNIRARLRDTFNGWEFRTTKLICCMRVIDPPYHQYEEREKLP